jgi:hypothetical protein
MVDMTAFSAASIGFAAAVEHFRCSVFAWVDSTLLG